MSDRLNVAVLMGGRTPEHEVSLSTGLMVVEAINKARYNVTPVQITRSGEWLIPKGFIEGRAVLPRTRQLTYNFNAGNDLVPLGMGGAITHTLEAKIDVAFIAMHGAYGEDGCIQGMLEVMDIPYTGSGVTASAIAMDKVLTKDIVSQHGIDTPKHVVLDAFDWRYRRHECVRRVEDDLGFPCVVKTRRAGSSIGIAIARSAAEFNYACDEIVAYDDDFFVEELVVGKEVTCSVLGNPPGRKPRALPVTEIIPREAEYFDYRSKYKVGGADEITPARINDRLTEEIQQGACRVHQILGCGGMSRTDMIVRDGRPYFLETNTIPGMTQTSLYPQAARAAGIEFPDLLDHLIRVAIAHHRRRRGFLRDAN